MRILDGADPAQFPRYADLLDRNPLYQEWIKTAKARDDQLDVKQKAWLK